MFDEKRKKAFDLFINMLKASGKQNMTGIQIGCYAGQSTEFFINSELFELFYCIDPWTNGYDAKDEANNSVEQAEKVFDEKFKNNKKIIKIKEYSWNAINNFQDESIDFIYIDGNHQYDAVKKDLELYYPKIKNGGIISGHDYCLYWNGVKKAVDEFFKNKFSFVTFSDNSWMIYKK